MSVWRLAFMASALGLFVLSLMAIAERAQAQMLCQRADVLLPRLTEKFREVDIGGAAMGEKMVLRFFVSPGGKTYTIVMVNTAGLACILAAGRDIDLAPIPADGDKT